MLNFMKSIFVFEENGNFAEELKQEENFRGKTLERLGDRQLYLIKEITEGTDKETVRTMYQVPQSPASADFIWAVAKELEKEKFKIFIFGGEKRNVARLLLKAPLIGKERLGFFDNLTVVPDSEVPELKKGIEKDLEEIQ
jgi:hypothetical protein